MKRDVFYNYSLIEKKIQNLLKLRGLYTGKIDGKYEDNLRRAIYEYAKNYQIQHWVLEPDTYSYILDRIIKPVTSSSAAG